MSAHPANEPYTIDQSHLRRARNLARQSGCSVIAELEYLYTGSSEELVIHLAKLFGMKPVGSQEMHALTPAYDLLPLALSRRWQCLLFRNMSNGMLTGVIADPFDPDLQLWLNAQARSAVIICLTSTADLQEYLQRSNDEDNGSDSQEDLANQHLLATDAGNECMEIAGNLLRRVMRY